MQERLLSLFLQTQTQTPLPRTLSPNTRVTAVHREGFGKYHGAEQTRQGCWPHSRSPTATTITASCPRRSKTKTSTYPPPPRPPRNSMLFVAETASLLEGIELSSGLPSFPKQSLEPFTPGYMFFYRTLMDSEVLRTVTGVSELPAIEEAYITGYEMRMWGIYPALVPCTEGNVVGTAWKVEEEGHFFGWWTTKPMHTPFAKYRYTSHMTSVS